uniref:Uncharacterized protein n=1 Tax=Anguilla anguilla TaxID=7936 RepID=A0A0E9QY20_ANGAN
MFIVSHSIPVSKADI